MPEKTELHNLLQPVFEHLEKEYPDSVLIVRNYKAELLTENDSIALYNEKMFEKYLTPEAFSHVLKLATDIGRQEGESAL
jgi:ADP-heptose:LPS heptosyltransferase